MRYFKSKGVKIIYSKSLKNVEDFRNIFSRLGKLGYSRLFLESGLKFLNFLIDCKMIYNLYVFQSNKYLRNKSDIIVVPKNVPQDNLFK